jgi:hypothetical protein
MVMPIADAAAGLTFSSPARVVRSFPSARLPSYSGGLPVEVSLIAQLGHGAGNQLIAGVMARQSAHQHFLDELDEPSARIGDTDFSKGDPTSLYLFAVGTNGHPFHRHAGHRVFTAISGSGGTRLRFSSVSDAELARDPGNFIAAMRCVEIPPDCLFTVRFGGSTWHQFTPLREPSPHPALFAVSCHTNELGGALTESLKQQVLADEANIPSLTELLPAAVTDLLRREPLSHTRIPTITLSLDAPSGSMQSRLCQSARCAAGWLRGQQARLQRSSGFLQDSSLTVTELTDIPADSLLRWHMNDGPVHHQDTFLLSLVDPALARLGSHALLAGLLDGFLHNPPTGVSHLMALRNLLVMPLGLSTSPLGCPVASLLSPQRDRLFGGRFPVHDQLTDRDDRRCQVVLGVNDKHLSFRSCVGVAISGERIDFSLDTRVRFRNGFGRIYMALIDHVHRGYISPAMLRQAVEHVMDAQHARHGSAQAM